MISIPVFGAGWIRRALRRTTRITSATYASSLPAYATQPTKALIDDITIETRTGASTPPCRFTPGSSGDAEVDHAELGQQPADQYADRADQDRDSGQHPAHQQPDHGQQHDQPQHRQPAVAADLRQRPEGDDQRDQRRQTAAAASPAGRGRSGGRRARSVRARAGRRRPAQVVWPTFGLPVRVVHCLHYCNETTRRGPGRPTAPRIGRVLPGSSLSSRRGAPTAARVVDLGVRVALGQPDRVPALVERHVTEVWRHLSQPVTG